MRDIIAELKRKLGFLPGPEDQGRETHMKDIVHVHVIKSTATMEASKVRELCEELGDRFPEDECFLLQLNDYDDDYEEKVCEDEDCECVNDDDARFCKACGRRLPTSEKSTLQVERLDWCGYESGRSFHPVFVKHVVPHISGRIEAVALLEGDDDVPPKMLGILIENGTYTKCDVEVLLRRATGE